MAEFNKGTRAFKGRWTESSGEYLTSEILLETPMFWFMKYKWSRSEIETLFFKAHIVIDEKFDSALKQTFGGDVGPRWKGINESIQNNDDWKHNKTKQRKKLEKSKDSLKSVQILSQLKPITGTYFELLFTDYAKWRQPTDDSSQIYVQCPDGNVLKLDVNLIEPLHYVKKQIVVKTNSKYSELNIILFYNGNELLNNIATLESYGINKGVTLKLSMGLITINIQQSDGAVLQIIVDKCSSVTALKNKMERIIYPAIPAQEQQLYHTENRTLQNEMKQNDTLLFEYDINDADFLYLGAAARWHMPMGADVYGVFVESPDGDTLALHVVSKDVISYIKLQIHAITNGLYGVNDQRLRFQRNELKNEQRLSDYNVVKNDILQLSTGDISLFVQTREGYLMNLRVDSHDLVGDIKRIIQGKTGGVDGDYSVEDQRLFNKVNDEELIDDNNTLFQYRIVDKCKLYLAGTIMINIRNGTDDIDGMLINFEIDPKYETQKIKQIIATKCHIPVVQQTLFLNDMQLNDTKKLIAYDIKKNDIIDLRVTRETCMIFIESADGTRIKLEIPPKDNILSIKRMIARNSNINVPARQQILYFKNFELNDGTPLDRYNIAQNAVIELKIAYKIFIQRTDGSRMQLNVCPNDEILSIKKQIENISTPFISVMQQILIFNDNVLDDAKIINQYKIIENSVIVLNTHSKSKKLKKSKKHKGKKKLKPKKKKRKKTVRIAKIAKTSATAPNLLNLVRRSFSAKNLSSAFDYEQLFGNDQNGDLIVGAITSKKHAPKTKPSYNNNMKPPRSQMKHRKSFSAKNMNEMLKPQGYDIDSVFDMTEINSIMNDLDIHSKDELASPTYDDYDSDELSSYDSGSYQHISSKLVQSSMYEVNGPEVPETNTQFMAVPATITRRLSDIEREIDFDEEDLTEKIAFQNERKHDFDDLMDGLFSDEDENDEKAEQKPQQMTLKTLLQRFRLPTNNGLYEYYHKTLNIVYAHELVQHLPAKVTQPPLFRSTKIRMLLTKMSRFVIDKVLKNEWDGIAATKWTELETNTFSYTFSPPQMSKIVKFPLDYIKSEDILFEDINSNKIAISGEKMIFVDRVIRLNTSINVNVRVEALPDMDSEAKQHHVVIIGVTVCDQHKNELDTVYISDRCVIYRNNCYLNMLSSANHIMLENDSEIGVNVDYRADITKIKFLHLCKGKRYKHNERELVLDDLVHKKHSFLKIFVHQFYGKGIYSIYEILPIQTEKSKRIAMKKEKTNKKVIRKSGNKSIRNVMNRKRRKSV